MNKFCLFISILINSLVKQRNSTLSVDFYYFSVLSTELSNWFYFVVQVARRTEELTNLIIISSKNFLFPAPLIHFGLRCLWEIKVLLVFDEVFDWFSDWVIKSIKPDSITMKWTSILIYCNFKRLDYIYSSSNTFALLYGSIYNALS